MRLKIRDENVFCKMNEMTPKICSPGYSHILACIVYLTPCSLFRALSGTQPFTRYKLTVRVMRICSGRYGYQMPYS